MTETPQRALLIAFEQFLTTPLALRLAGDPNRSPELELLDHFRRTAAEVPAYRAFLAEHGIDPAALESWEQFQQLPLVDKGNYVQRYPLAERCRHGRATSCDMVALSSGSTGTPTPWLRSLSDELAIATRFEQIFHDSFAADRHSTLAVVCFALGSWVGGMFTAQCCRLLAAKGYPISVVTPGNQREEIFRAVESLGPAYEQVVLLGYPPFLKDTIDAGRTRGIDWGRYRLKLVMAGEVFSEAWRDLVGERMGGRDPLRDTASLYGTADAGVLGNETPLSIAIRRFLAARPELARELFGESRLPTLVQYDPRSRYFEQREGTLLFSGDNGMPLVRYHIGDRGGLFDYPTLLARLAPHGFDPATALGAEGRGHHPLPFVYLFGRSQFVVSYFGANVYPENISVALEQPEASGWVTGKFVLEVVEDADQNRRLRVTVELAAGEAASAQRATHLAELVERQLCHLNSEYAHYVPAAYRPPEVVLRPLGDPDHFPPGVKHRYTRRPATPPG